MARWLLIAVVLLACSKAGQEGEAKRWQEAPPPKELTIPAGLAITLSVDGTDKPPLTSDVLTATKPDFIDDDHRAWRVATLVPEAVPGTVVEAAAKPGVAVRFDSPTPDGLEPVLFLTRRGEVIVAALDPKDPFPKFHGQGSRLKRPGDTTPRVWPVTRLAVITKK